MRWSRSASASVLYAGLPRFRLYDLWHTYATHLRAEGAPITCVVVQLGHARATTTLAHYAHWIPQDNTGWVERLAARREPESEKFGTKVGTKPGSEAEGVPELPELAGAGGGS